MHVSLLAQRLFFLKPLLNLSFVIGIMTIVILFINGSIESQNTYAVPCLLFATWSLLFSAIIGLLAQIPNTSKVNKGWFSGIKSKLVNLMFFSMIIAFIAISLALLYATIKILSL